MAFPGPLAERSDSVYRKEQQQSLDSDKQVVDYESQSGADNAPMVLEQAKEAVVRRPLREADKEVTSSWQVISREDSAPIPVEPMSPHVSTSTFHMTRERPPPYGSLERDDSGPSLPGFASPSLIEPDATPDTLAARLEDRSAVGQLLSWIPSTTRVLPRDMPRLEKPVVIPQLDVPPVGESVPFQRCYSDLLACHDVTMRDFTAFLDGLAIAQAPGPTLQGLKVFGAGVSMLPLPLLPLAGRGISALATAGSGHSGSRARLYLTRATRQYFAPRRLRVHIVSDDDLGPLWLRMPSGAPRLAPLAAHGLMDSICTRRLRALEAYTAPLRFDVPALDYDAKAVDKLARKHLSHRIGRGIKDLAKSREEQRAGGAKGLEAEMEEVKKCARLKWIVVESF